MESGEPSLPAELLERLERIVPPDRLAGMLGSLAAPRRHALRVNPLRGTREGVARELAAEGIELEELPWYPDAFVLDAGALARLQETDAHRRGAVWVQNPSSMLPPLWLAPRPGESVLDLCAAPGSKTTQLAALMGDEGRIVANDRSRRRCYKLEAVLREQGVRCAEVSSRAGEVFGRVRTGAFDRVLVDAPCSGEGRLVAGDREAGADWSLKKVRRLAAQQRRLLISGLHALRPGGAAVYSTCTFAPEENEGVIDQALRHFDGAVEVAEPPLELPAMIPALSEWGGRAYRHADELVRCRRVLPDGLHEGFFLARLERRS